MNSRQFLVLGSVLIFIGLLATEWATGFTAGCISETLKIEPEASFTEVATLCNVGVLAFWIPMNMSLILGIAFLAAGAVESLEKRKLRKKS